MTFDKQFSLENMSMSVLGHLMLIALMITSFAIVVTRAKLVTPDRVQITEIDLSTVKITRDETALFNTEVPKQEQVKRNQESAKKTKPEPVVGDDKPIEKPTLVEPEKTKKTEPAKKEEPKPAPVQRTVVRVNREAVTRTMTVSVVDALRVALTRCWVIDTTRSDIEDIRAVAHLTMYKNGAIRDVWFESAAREATDPAFAYVLETIRGALSACQPFKMLPENEFDHWEKIQLTFYPTQGTIM